VISETLHGFAGNQRVPINDFKINEFNLNNDALKFLDDFLGHSKLDIDKQDLNPVTHEIGMIKWYKYRLFISNMFSSIREINLQKLSSYLDYQYTFFGYAINNYYLSERKFKHELTLNIFDPELDDSKFSDGMKDFEGIDEKWFTSFGQGMFDQNSHNFKEFLQTLSSLRTRMLSPCFILDKTKIIRKSNTILTSDGRIKISHSEEILQNCSPWVIQLLMLMGILLFVRVISPQFFASVTSVVVENLIRIDISLIPGKALRVALTGLGSLKNVPASASKHLEKVRKFVLLLYNKLPKGSKGSKLPALPEWRESTPDELARLRLPPARPG